MHVYRTTLAQFGRLYNASSRIQHTFASPASLLIAARTPSGPPKRAICIHAASLPTSSASTTRTRQHLAIDKNIYSHPSYQPKRKMSSSLSAMGKRLAGKTIVITGASSGIGRSTAMEFARTAGPGSGLKLILTARRIDVLKQIAEDIKKEVASDIEVLPVKLDVGKSEEVRGFVGNLPQGFKDIDVLVNNAGLTKGVDKAPDINEDEIRETFDINVHGLINMTQAIMPIYKARGESGQGDIINVGSIAGRAGYPGGSVYCASKAAVRTFTDALRKEQIASRIRVMEIDPGQVETEFSLVRFRGDKEKADAVYKGVEALTPDDIAEVIVFMAGRRENVVIADAMIFPNHQASATQMHRKS